MKKLGFGLMRLPCVEGTEKVDIARVCDMADAFLANGYTYFDTAAVYHKGESEIAFREAVAKRHPRESYVIADKLSLMVIEKQEDIPAFFEAQFERLGVTYIDYYLVHCLTTDSYRKAVDMHAFDFVKKQKEEGRVRHIGFSFHDSPELLEKILTEQPEMEFVQLQINYLDWEDKNVASRRCAEVAARFGKPIIVMEPVKGGSLADFSGEARSLLESTYPEKSLASFALRFAASVPGVFMVLSGMSDEKQLADNVNTFAHDQPFSREEWDLAARTAQLIRENTAIPCTACRYCVDGCPQKIAIPEYFSTYNNYYRFGQPRFASAKGRYQKISSENGKASACIGCGLCETNCPQHIEIRRMLGVIADAFEK